MFGIHVSLSEHLKIIQGENDTLPFWRVFDEAIKRIAADYGMTEDEVFDRLHREEAFLDPPHGQIQ